MTELRFIVQAVEKLIEVDDFPMTHTEFRNVIVLAHELRKMSTSCSCNMISIRQILKDINEDQDYTTAEIVAMGFKQFSVFNAIKKGHLEGKRIFGKIYINGAVLKEYFIKGLRKS